MSWRISWADAPVSVILAYSFFFTVAVTTDIYTLSLHDALPIYRRNDVHQPPSPARRRRRWKLTGMDPFVSSVRSEEHTSELQSLRHLVCRLLLEKKMTALLRNKSRSVLDSVSWTSKYNAL